MDNYEDIDEAAQEEEKKKKGGKKGEGEAQGAMSAGEALATEGFYQKMGLMGVPANLVQEILRGWKHLQGHGLVQALAQFFTGKARASAHAQVEIKKGRDFSLVHNLFQTVKDLPRQLAQRLHHDHRNTPSGPQ